MSRGATPKERPCRECSTAFLPRHFLSRFCGEVCRKAAQITYKRERYAAGFTYRKRPGERYFPAACKNCGDQFQPKSGRDRHCASCKQKRDRWQEDVVGALLRSARTRRPEGCNLTREWFEDRWRSQKGLCALSRAPMVRERARGAGNLLGKEGLKVSVDRIDNAGPYSQANCRLVCVTVNLMRGSMTDDVLVEWCRRIYSAFERGRDGA